MRADIKRHRQRSRYKVGLHFSDSKHPRGVFLFFRRLSLELFQLTVRDEQPASRS